MFTDPRDDRSRARAEYWLKKNRYDEMPTQQIFAGQTWRNIHIGTTSTIAEVIEMSVMAYVGNKFVRVPEWIAVMEDGGGRNNQRVLLEHWVLIEPTAPE